MDIFPRLWQGFRRLSGIRRPHIIRVVVHNESMELSVIICTWNRANLLQVTLQSLADLKGGGGTGWELIVIDNNSTDDTAQTCDRFAGQLPLRRIDEPRQGHSFSRNRGAAEAHGEFLVWTDDDVIVSSGWLDAWREAFERHRSASFFGGPIEPDYQGVMPRWLEQNRDACDRAFAKRDLGDQPIELNARTLPFGANFATRRSVQLEFPFRAEFGRIGSGVRGHDEIDVLGRMVVNGHSGFWVPAARLRHMIPSSRLNTAYIYDYYHGQGQTWIASGRGELSADELARHIRHHRLRYWLKRGLRAPRAWFPHLVQLGILRGQLDELNSAKNPHA